MPIPLSTSLMENYLMKNKSPYDIIDVINIIKACDSEYIAINNESIKDNK